MAFTITSNTVTSLGSTKAPGTTAFTMGQYLEWNIDILASGGDIFTNKDVFFNPAMWLESNLPDGATSILPGEGFSAKLGTAVDTGFFEIIPNGVNLSWKNAEVEYTLSTATTLSIKIKFFSSFDVCSYYRTSQINNTYRLQKNSLENPLSFNNDISSVYNKEKDMRAHIVVGDTSTGVIDGQVFAKYQMESHFYESGVAGGAQEFTDWTFVFERGGDVVTDLSIYEDTTLKATLDIGASSISSDWQLIVYRDDDTQSNIPFSEDMRLGFEASTGEKFGIDYITSFVTWTLVAGTVYEIEFVLDSSKFDRGGSYKFIIVATDAGKTFFNSASTKNIAAAVALPSATTGTMTGEIKDYNDIYTGNCLQVTAYERIESCVEVDKASYLADLATQSLPGDFDTNFFSLQVVVTLFDGTVVLDVNDRIGDPSLTITDTFNTYTSCLLFRVQPEWANIPFRVDHIYTYTVAIDEPYQDVITFRQLFNADDLEENEPVADQFLTDLVFKDQSGNIVKEICEDFDGPLVVEVTKIATVDDYNLIAVIKRDIVGLDPDEEESYDNNILEQLQSSLLLNVETTFGVDNLASFEVEDDLLEVGEKYRIVAIAKKENLTPPVQCPVINVLTETEATSVVPSGSDIIGTFAIDYTITNFAPSTVSGVTINTSTDPKLAGSAQVDVFVTDTNSYVYIVTWVGGFTGDPVTIIMDMEITLANGCTYDVTFNHVVLPLLGSTTSLDEDVNAN